MWLEVIKLVMPIGAIVALLAWALSRNQIRRLDPFPAAARAWKRVFAGCWVVGMTSIVALTVLVYGNHPHQSEPEVGRVYSYNLHGTGIYLTREELGALHVFETSGASCVLLAFGCGFIMQRQQSRENDRKDVGPKPGSES